MTAPDPGERERLFVALELPAAARGGLSDWRGQVLRDRRELRMVPPEGLHVTLCFLGWRRVDEIEAIAGACGIVAGASGGRLTLGRPLWLPPRRPGVLAVELDQDGDALERIQAALARRLQSGGWYEPEARPFLAHVTVARLRRGARMRRTELPSPPALSFTAETVTLYRSRLARGGAQYEPLRSVALSISP